MAIAGVVVPVLALIPWGGDEDSDPTLPSTSTSSSTTYAPVPPPSTVTSDPPSMSESPEIVLLRLSSREADEGAGAVEADGDDLVVSCPTGGSGHQYTQLTYALPGAYTGLAFGLEGEGTDADAYAAVQVLVQERGTGADPERSLGVIDWRPGGSVSANEELGEETLAVSFRISCRPGEVARVIDPRVTRAAT